MRPKRLISLLVAVCMMITMLPLSAVTAFAADTSTELKADDGTYRYAYTVDANGNATITDFLGPVKSTNKGPYDIIIPAMLDKYSVTGLGEYSFSDRDFRQNIQSVTIPESVTSIGDDAFYYCSRLKSLTIKGAVKSMGEHAFAECRDLATLSLCNNIQTIGDYAFDNCPSLEAIPLPKSLTSIGAYAFAINPAIKQSSNKSISITIPGTVTQIGDSAFYNRNNLTSATIEEGVQSTGLHMFYGCDQLTTVTLPESLTTIADGSFTSCSALGSVGSVTIPDNVTYIGDCAFSHCKALKTITIPEKVTTIRPLTFDHCLQLKYITLPAGLTSFVDNLNDCPAGSLDPTGPNGAIYYNNYKTPADRLLKKYEVLAGRNFLYLCKVTFDANGGSLTGYDEVPVYKTEKITDTKANELTSISKPTRAGYNFTGWYTKDGHFFDVNETAITENITLHAGWDKAPVYHPLTVTGGTATVEKDGQPLNIVPVVTSDKKTYSVPDGAKVTVTLDKTAVPNGKVFDSWSTGNLSLTGQDYKTTSITFTMNSDVDIAAQYRDAAPDHTHDTAVCHPLTVTGGTATVEKDGQPLNIVPVVTSDKKTYSVPDGAKVTVTLDKTAVPNGKVFDSWSTGNLSLTGQDYKATSITFTMSSDVDIAAQYRDAATDHTHDTAVCHPLTVTGGIVTVKKGDKDVTDTLTVTTDETTGKKTYSVPEGAEVTVTLDKTAVPNGKVFDGWSTSLPTGQDYKAETITFTMSSGVDIAAQYRNAAADHTPATAVCHPLTVTGGIVTVKKGDKDVTDTLTVTTDETTGKKTYYVPDNATVTVTLDKTLVPEGMVFDIWSTGKFSLPLGQDYKAESITFPMSSDVVDIAAQYRDASIEDDGPNVLGTAAIIGTAAVGTAVLGYQAYSLGAEFAGKLMALPYFPSNRSALAMMLWEDAGKPMPESELLYPDVGQEERDMDLQHAARWAMENELIPDLNDEGTAPEEMKFFPANPVSKLDVLNAWQKAQELKNN